MHATCFGLNEHVQVQFSYESVVVKSNNTVNHIITSFYVSSFTSKCPKCRSFPKASIFYIPYVLMKLGTYYYAVSPLSFLQIYKHLCYLWSQKCKMCCRIWSSNSGSYKELCHLGYNII
jgi:hypothetical protein